MGKSITGISSGGVKGLGIKLGIGLLSDRTGEASSVMNPLSTLTVWN